VFQDLTRDTEEKKPPMCMGTVNGSGPTRPSPDPTRTKLRLDKEMVLKSIVYFRRRRNFVRVNFVRVGSGEGRMGPGRGSSSTLIARRRRCNFNVTGPRPGLEPATTS